MAADQTPTVRDRPTQPDPGCVNCDGIGCMDCRTRTVHDGCVHDCPSCGPADPDPVTRARRRAAADEIRKALAEQYGMVHLGPLDSADELPWLLDTARRVLASVDALDRGRGVWVKLDAPAPVVCGDMTGPHGVGGECVLAPGHPHVDGIGGQWPAAPTASDSNSEGRGPDDPAAAARPRTAPPPPGARQHGEADGYSNVADYLLGVAGRAGASGDTATTPPASMMRSVEFDTGPESGGVPVHFVPAPTDDPAGGAVPADRPGGLVDASAQPSPDDIEYDGPDHPLEDYRTWRRYVAVPVADDDAVEVVGVVPPHDFEPIARANPHPGDVDPHDEAVFALCNIVHEQITAAGIHCPDTGAAVLCWDLAARLVGAGVTLLRDDDKPAVVEVAVETLEASHRRLLHAQGLIATEIGRVSLALRRAAGAVVPDPEETP